MPVTQPPDIQWPIGLLEVGDSFFVPVLTSQPTVDKLRKMAAERGMVIDYRMGIDRESSMYGMRVIRVS